MPIADGLWDMSFREKFCASCEREDCDTEHCPHQDERNNPLWWLMQAAEGEPMERRYVWRGGRLELKSGMIVLLRGEERSASGTCNEFNVYLNGKWPDGKVLRNIKRVILPTVSTTENGQIDPMDIKLVFGGCEDAAEIVALLGKKCKLEVRAAVENWNQDGRVEFHGLSYILEAVPLQIDPDTVKRRTGLGLTIGFLVYRYTATIGDTQLWDFEWTVF